MNKYFLLGLTLLLTFTSIAQKKKEKPALDGKSFVSAIGEIKEGKAPTKAIEDKVKFKGGNIESDYIIEKTKFEPLKYTITKDSTGTDENDEEIKIYMFEALSANEKGEELKWEGTVTGQSIEAKVIWSKKGKVKKEFVLTGESKDKKK